MYRLVVASAVLVAVLSMPAFAADPTVDVPMTAPGFDWTGYYAGLQAGYGWGSADIDSSGGAPFSASPDLHGGFVGGHVAGLWQFDQAVLGAEADLNYASVDGATDIGVGDSAGADLKWFGSVNAKAGYAMVQADRYCPGCSGPSCHRCWPWCSDRRSSTVRSLQQGDGECAMCRHPTIAPSPTWRDQPRGSRLRDVW